VGCELLDEIAEVICQYIAVKASAVAAEALWILNTYTYDAFEVCPYLSITSPEMRCGKTRNLDVVPCRHIERYKEQKRRRFLNIEELARLGAALAKAETENSEPPMAIAAIRLLIFTGARLSEILTLKWEYVRWEIGALLLPDSKTGFKAIQLSAPARQLLEAIPVVDGNPHVIIGKKRGQRFVGLQSIWERIRDEAALPDVRLHDLRHSFASVGAAAGLGLPIIGALLGHSDMATTHRYAHLAADPLKAAAELIAGKLNEALKP
jgi:integrase